MAHEFARLVGCPHLPLLGTAQRATLLGKLQGMCLRGLLWPSGSLTFNVSTHSYYRPTCVPSTQCFLRAGVSVHPTGGGIELPQHSLRYLFNIAVPRKEVSPFPFDLNSLLEDWCSSSSFLTIHLQVRGL